jgi:plasmid stabilization system protein ParE
MEKTARYKIVVSDRARQMLTAHLGFLARSSPQAARKIKNEIMDAIRSLEEMPERFPFIAGEFLPPNKYHKLFVQKWYLILYQIKQQTVHIDYIVDCRQEYQWLTQ